MVFANPIWYYVSCLRFMCFDEVGFYYLGLVVIVRICLCKVLIYSWLCFMSKRDHIDFLRFICFDVVGFYYLILVCLLEYVGAKFWFNSSSVSGKSSTCWLRFMSLVMFHIICRLISISFLQINVHNNFHLYYYL